ncbi:MAG: DUF4870 domain-containing protein [Granulosicoccus sp.]|nr:DUF4870 domain-containing protein [Granulosicoccus sp.]
MQNELTTGEQSTGKVKVVYILYLLGLLIPFISIIGVVIAYIYRSDASEWLQQHYRYQIRTFWIGMLYALAASILVFIFVGYLLIVLWLIWMVVRCVKGLKALGDNAPPVKPGTWLF